MRLFFPTYFQISEHVAGSENTECRARHYLYQTTQLHSGLLTLPERHRASGSGLLGGGMSFHFPPSKEKHKGFGYSGCAARYHI